MSAASLSLPEPVGIVLTGTGREVDLSVWIEHIEKAKEEIYGWFVDVAEYGFQDGGCWIFAAALKKWSGDRLALYAVAHVDDHTRVEHVVASQDGFVLLDSDGIFSREEMITKVLFDMGTRSGYGPDDLAVDPFVSDTLIPYDQGLVDAVAQDLDRLLPSFEAFADACGIAPEPLRPR